MSRILQESSGFSRIRRNLQDFVGFCRIFQDYKGTRNMSSKVDPRKWIPTPEILEKIREQSRMGVTEANIARNVGLHPSTFSEKKSMYPEVAEAIRDGMATGENLAVGALWNMIQDTKHKGHLTAVIFYLKCRHGWSDGSRQSGTTVETTAPSGVTFEILQKGDPQPQKATVNDVVDDVILH